MEWGEKREDQHGRGEGGAPGPAGGKPDGQSQKTEGHRARGGGALDGNVASSVFGGGREGAGGGGAEGRARMFRGGARARGGEGDGGKGRRGGAGKKRPRGRGGEGNGALAGKGGLGRGSGKHCVAGLPQAPGGGRVGGGDGDGKGTSEQQLVAGRREYAKPVG